MEETKLMISDTINENRKCPVLYVVVPCYNEELVIDKSAELLKNKLEAMISDGIIAKGSRIAFVNDGSKDGTLAKLYELTKKDNIYAVVNLAANRGHQNAILAGMMVMKDFADIIITIDADLQQDINAMEDFINCYIAGSDVVYGVRNDRNTDGAFKKLSATMYYKLMHMLGSDIVTNHADYRLMSRKALEALSEYGESNLFLRGLIPSMGFSSDIVYFDVKEREAGESKYTLAKMLKLALDGITSFSVRPLHLIGFMGMLTVLGGLILCVTSIVEWAQGKNVPGYTTLIIVMLFAFGVVLVSLGIIGEYIGKIYMETKQRPHYIIDTVVLKKEDADGQN